MIDLIKKYKHIIIGAVCVIAVLAVAFFAGGSLSEEPKTVSTQDTAQSITQSVTEVQTEITAKNNSTEETKTQPTTQVQSTTKVKPTTVDEKQESTTSVKATQSIKKDKYQTEEVPQGKPEPVEPQEQETKDNTLKCTLSISCATILNNMSELDKSKTDLVPSDGWILKPETVTFKEGESVFDLLESVCKEKGIHLEFSFVPLYNTQYIEGINNIYEFDCGSLSGWRYSVNGWFPNYGSSRYEVQNGDVIEFKYTCNYGDDIGANSF